MAGVLLEVAVGDPRDVPGAAEGGADRLHVVVPGPACGLSPEPALVSAICRESDLPAFVLLRLNDSWTTTGGEFARLVGLGEDYLGCGATGVAFGFLDAELEIDTETCRLLLDRLPNVPWTFHRAIDSSLDPRRSWRRLLGLPRLVAVRTAGSPRGMSAGFDDLLATITPEIAPLAMPGGGLDGRAGAVAGQGGRAAAPPRRPGAAGRLGQGVRRRRLRPLVAVAGRRPARGDAPGRRGPMILIDPPLVPSRGRMWSHLASDTSYDELHAFARGLGVPERGFDRDHYDVPEEWYDEAVALGAVPVTSRELIVRLRDAGLRRRKRSPLAAPDPGEE